MYYDLVTDAIMETCSGDLIEKSHMKRVASNDSATPFASVVVIKRSCRRYRNPCPLFPQGITDSSYYAQTGNESRPETLMLEVRLVLRIICVVFRYGCC
jgi:hypothetical protein